MNRLFFTFILVVSSAFPLAATHIVGGEITYRCLGNNQYEFTLTVYRDCYTGIPWFDNPASVGVYDAQWNLVKELTLPWDVSSNDTLPIILTDPCLTVPPDVCAHGTRYKGVVSLPFKPGGYSVVYQRCCRNQLIRNIVGPLRTGISIVSYISESALQACNNSVVFNQWPPVAICIHQPIDFDHSATDPDDDSLVYRLCTPLKGADSLAPIPQPPLPGPYLDVDWRSPYNLSNVLGGDPLKIDPATGFLTGIPNMIGNFVVGVCVDEYRDGQLISTTRRDFQYNVSDCGQPLAAFFVPEVLCDTLTVKFFNEGLQTHDYQWFFDLGGDTTMTSTAYSPTWTFPDTGVYVVMLIAESKPTCRDTFSKTIRLTNSYADAELQFQFADCDENGLLVQAIDLSSDPVYGISSWQWTLTAPGGGVAAQSSEQNPTFTVMMPGDYLLNLTVTAGNGCMEMLTLPFYAPIPPLNLFKDSLTICVGDTVSLLAGANASFNYTWSPPDFLSDATAPNPLAFPLNTTTYAVTVTGNGPCVIEKTVKVIVKNPGVLEATAMPPVIFPGGNSQLEATLTGGSVFIWEPANSLSNPTIPNPVASPQITTTYTVTAPIADNCILRDTVTVTVRSPLCEEPFVFFPTGFSPNGDSENDALKLESNIVTEVYWVIFNRWGEKVFEANALDDNWDGTFRGNPQPAETYGYYLRVKCLGGEEFVKKGNVTLLR